MVKRPVLLMVFLLLFLIVVLGCEAPYGYVGDEPAASCSAQCLQAPPQGFEGPVLLWAGDPEEVPACPEQAPEIVFEGYDGLNDAPVECAPCECSQPMCKMPAGVNASTSPCGLEGPETVYTPFLAPDSWDGSCVAPTPPAPPELLDAAYHLPTREEPCAPIVEVPEAWSQVPPFTIRTRACRGTENLGRCQDSQHTCLAASDPPPGFRRCIRSLRPSEASCPVAYPDEVSFFAELADERACTPCTCSQIVASQCMVHMELYGDAACSFSSGLVGKPVASMPTCSGISGGMTLGSMRAEWMTNLPGTCTAGGGAPMGQVMLSGLQNFCCEEPPAGA